MLLKYIFTGRFLCCQDLKRRIRERRRWATVPDGRDETSSDSPEPNQSPESVCVCVCFQHLIHLYVHILTSVSGSHTLVLSLCFIDVTGFRTGRSDRGEFRCRLTPLWGPAGSSCVAQIVLKNEFIQYKLSVITCQYNLQVMWLHTCHGGCASF